MVKMANGTICNGPGAAPDFTSTPCSTRNVTISNVRSLQASPKIVHVAFAGPAIHVAFAGPAIHVVFAGPAMSFQWGN